MNYIHSGKYDLKATTEGDRQHTYISNELQKQMYQNLSSQLLIDLLLLK